MKFSENIYKPEANKEINLHIWHSLRCLKKAISSINLIPMCFVQAAFVHFYINVPDAFVKSITSNIHVKVLVHCLTSSLTHVSIISSERR